jgi:hypothetical protein
MPLLAEPGRPAAKSARGISTIRTVVFALAWRRSCAFNGLHLSMTASLDREMTLSERGSQLTRRSRSRGAGGQHSFEQDSVLDTHHVLAFISCGAGSMRSHSRVNRWRHDRLRRRRWSLRVLERYWSAPRVKWNTRAPGSDAPRLPSRLWPARRTHVGAWTPRSRRSGIFDPEREREGVVRLRMEDAFHHGPVRLAHGGRPGGPADEAVHRVAVFRPVQRKVIAAPIELVAAKLAADSATGSAPASGLRSSSRQPRTGRQAPGR